MKIKQKNMQKRFSIFAVGICAAVIFLMARPSWALTVDVVSMTPTPQQDITDMIDDAPEGVGIVGWILEKDVEYTAVLAVDEAPAVVITPGGDVALDQPWVYDETNGQLTVVFTSTGLKQVGEDAGPENVAIIAVVPPVPLGEDGPPVEMTGATLSTNVQNWELIPPSENNHAFGFSLTGPEGETGFVHMYMPQGIIDLLSQFSGEELAIEDLAVFNGDSQSSMSITEVEGGAYIDINVTFTEAAVVSPTATNGSVTKSITVREQLPISLAVNKSEIKAGKTSRVFGWLKNGKKNETVTVWRKLKGENTFTKWKTVTTEQDGYYNVSFTARQTATYKAKYRTNKGVKVSTAEKITVNK